MKENQLSWMIAIAFHMLILFFLMLYHVKMPERLEIDQIEVIALEEIKTETSDPAQSRVGEKGKQKPSPAYAQTKVTLPGSTVNFEDAVKIHHLPVKKSDRINESLLRSQVDDQLLASNSPSLSSGSKNELLIGNKVGLSTDTNERSGLISDGNSSFQIEGDVISRQILKKELPKYPDNIQKDGTVRLQFTVLPDGSVGDIVIIKKSDPVFENLSIQALHKWKFNRSDRKNTGIISFHFKME